MWMEVYSSTARRAPNPEVAGSDPTPATILFITIRISFFGLQQFSQFLFGFRLLAPLRFIYKEKMNVKYRRKQEKRR